MSVYLRVVAILAALITPAAAQVSLFATNPTSTLTLPATTTAYSAGWLIANSATAGAVVTPSFTIANIAGAVQIYRVRLTTNDPTSTSWGTQTIRVDLWSAAPVWLFGDRGVWSVTTGSATHLAAFSCIMSAMQGDGAYAECAPTAGNSAIVRLASGSTIFWSLNAITGSGVTGANKAFTLTVELMN